MSAARWLFVLWWTALAFIYFAFDWRAAVAWTLIEFVTVARIAAMREADE